MPRIFDEGSAAVECLIQIFDSKIIIDNKGKIKMPKYFFIDSSGQKQGPINEQQLQTLTAKGVITPETVLETDTGHRGKAHQIPGLIFTNPTNQTATGAAPMPSGPITYVTQFRFRSDTDNTPITQLLFDLSFRELKPESLYLWIVKIAYVTGVVVAILGTLIYCGFTVITAFRFASISNGVSLLSLFLIPIVCIGCFFALCLLRLTLEWAIITLHYGIIWMVELVKLLKAARIYLEEKSKH